MTNKGTFQISNSSAVFPLRVNGKLDLIVWFLHTSPYTSALYLFGCLTNSDLIPALHSREKSRIYLLHRGLPQYKSTALQVALQICTATRAKFAFGSIKRVLVCHEQVLHWCVVVTCSAYSTFWNTCTKSSQISRLHWQEISVILLTAKNCIAWLFLATTDRSNCNISTCNWAIYVSLLARTHLCWRSQNQHSASCCCNLALALWLWKFLCLRQSIWAYQNKNYHEVVTVKRLKLLC